MDYTDLLYKYSDLDFVNRVLNPSDSPAPLTGQDGRKHTHLMAAEVDANGQWYAFPTVVNNAGELQRMNTQEAYRHAVDTGEIIPFGEDKKAAIDFSKNYKTKEFKEYYAPGVE
jgi:hypothetical protein